MYWFLSDTHYHHSNIVEGTSKWSDKSGCRPFAALSAHDNWLIRTVNENVAAEDHLWFLGDWSFGGEGKIREFRDALNVQNIYICTGNHDHHIKRYQEAPEHYGFNWVCDYAEVNLNGTQIVLCHYPLESWVNMERGAYHLHGHVHGKSRQLPGRYDVGIDALGPLSLDELKTLPLSTEKRHPGLEGGNIFGSRTPRKETYD